MGDDDTNASKCVSEIVSQAFGESAILSEFSSQSEAETSESKKSKKKKRKKEKERNDLENTSQNEPEISPERLEDSSDDGYKLSEFEAEIAQNEKSFKRPHQVVKSP